MPPLAEYFRSVEHIWVLWIVSVALLAWLLKRSLAGLTQADWQALWAQEDGAAYSVSYVMTFPFFLLLVCLVVEFSLLLVVKIGSVSAATAAARSYIVWYSLDSGKANERSQFAAVQGMAAVASGSPLHQQGGGGGGAAEKYYQAYQRYSGENAPHGYITNKYRYASRATSLSVNPSSPGWNDDITVTLSYQMPFHLSVIGRFLGQSASGGRYYTYTIVSQATLQNQSPRNQEQKLGIDYVAP